MTAAALIRKLADTGVTLVADGARLHVEAKPGSITPDLRRLLAANKVDLIAALSGTDETRARLMRLAESEGREPALVDRIPPSDLPAYAEVPDDALRALLSMLSDDANREGGRVPTGDTAAILCRSCGPVWVHPAIAAALPVVGCWPRALGCPWCQWRAKRHVFPRPHVACVECRHRMPDAINPPQGAGRCAVGNEFATWPDMWHHCGNFRPGGDMDMLPEFSPASRARAREGTP